MDMPNSGNLYVFQLILPVNRTQVKTCEEEF
jgi:hypothetical protein